VIKIFRRLRPKGNHLIPELIHKSDQYGPDTGSEKKIIMHINQMQICKIRECGGVKLASCFILVIPLIHY
jgi:hypothetical protein